MSITLQYLTILYLVDLTIHHTAPACTIALQSPHQQLKLYKKLKNVSSECDRLNGWNSTLQAAWYIRHVGWTCLLYISFMIWFVWTKPTIWLLVKKKIVRACSILNPHEVVVPGTPYKIVFAPGIYFIFQFVSQRRHSHRQQQQHQQRCRTRYTRVTKCFFPHHPPVLPGDTSISCTW